MAFFEVGEEGCIYFMECLFFRIKVMNRTRILVMKRSSKLTWSALNNANADEEISLVRFDQVSEDVTPNEKKTLSWIFPALSSDMLTALAM